MPLFIDCFILKSTLIAAIKFAALAATITTSC